VQIAEAGDLRRRQRLNMRRGVGNGQRIGAVILPSAVVSVKACATVRVSAGVPASVSAIEVTWASALSAARFAATLAAVSEIAIV
jgi:hypothetical protein